MSIKNLVIVESPAKAKTIEKYLGEGFIVKSSMGHIRDLSSGDSAIDVKNGFLPKYEVPDEKKKLVAELKKYAKDAETIWLASDEDREGEAISWHLFEVLGLKAENTKRIVFNEITKTAILHAIENPRTIDKCLVDAQQARRVLDRLVGFELSPILWRKVQPKLSAGRVQSVAVKLVVEREREINEFDAKSEFKVIGEFKTEEGKILTAENTQKPKNADSAKAFLTSLMGETFGITGLEVKPTFRNPAPPFTTSTLQQEASRKLGYDVTTTMRIAQKLYEHGHITYMRTDSVNLSKMAMAAAKSEIESTFGEKYSQVRNYTTKNESAQEAHEAIRPTSFAVQFAGDDNREKKLYSLIWKRAIASQMAKAEMEKTVITIEDKSKKSKFQAEGEVIRFDGFLKVYMESKDDEEEDGEQEGLLPAVKVGEGVEMKKIKAQERFARPAPRYSEASLVKKLEELGIGRPSTYAPTITTIQKRQYVTTETREGKQRKIAEVTLVGSEITEEVKVENYGAEKNKLFPSDMGMLVTDFLSANFDAIMDYGFTASVEKQFDEIANGNQAWQDMLTGFYGPFHAAVDTTMESAERVTGERILGVHPVSGRQMSVRMGKFGPFVQIGSKDDEEKLVYASLQQGQSIETVTLENALKLFELPREIMIYEGEPVIAGIGRFGPYLKRGDKYFNVEKGTDLTAMTVEECEAILKEALSGTQFPLHITDYNGVALEVNKGRFGPYIKYQGQFISIPKGQAPETVTAEQAVALVEAKMAGAAAAVLKTFTEDANIQILNGRYGPYIKSGKDNVPIPKDKTWDSLVYADVEALVKGFVKKPKAAGFKSKKK
ncbi:MAG: type I DNA topoisomerase [Bacteroidetes bacterium]|jgi:DNA topoisomerase-1|nr:type I DNA topoisomerase [Bacteroidota bacterium]